MYMKSITTSKINYGINYPLSSPECLVFLMTCLMITTHEDKYKLLDEGNRLKAICMILYLEIFRHTLKTMNNLNNNALKMCLVTQQCQSQAKSQ